MTAGLSIVFETVKKVYPRWSALALILAAFFFTLLWKRKKRRGPRILAAYMLFALVIFAFPFTAGILAKFMRHGEVYWRYLWIVPSTAVIAYMCTELTSASPSKALRALTGCLLAAVIVASGTSVYQGHIFQEASNREKLPEEAVTIVSVIDQNAESTGNPYKKVVVPNPWTDQIRQIDGTIQHPFGMRLWFPVPEDPETRFDDFKRIVNGYEPDHDGVLMFFLNRARINYIAAKDSFGFDETLREGGYSPLYSRDGLTIYYNPLVRAE